jgi:hypothetical protein
MEGSGEALKEPLEVDGETVVAACLSMGNPHAVVFVDDVDAAPVTTLGPLLEAHPAFPNKTNVEFVQVLDQRAVRQRTWERGVGETLACGTGACAVAVASQLRGFTGQEVAVELRGGRLSLAWSPGGTRLVVVGRRALFLRGGDGRPLGTIPVPAAATPRAAAVSPDGHTAAVTAIDGERTTLVLAALTPAGAPVRTALTQTGRLGAPTFSPDGRWILVTNGDRWLLVPTRGGAVRTTAATLGAVAGWVR